MYFFAELDPVIGSEQGGVRPVLIIQNDVGNQHSQTTIVAAITGQMCKAKLPTHVDLAGRENGLSKIPWFWWSRCAPLIKTTERAHLHAGQKHYGAGGPGIAN